MKRLVILSKYHLASLWNWRDVYISRLIEPAAYFVFLVAGISGMLSESFEFDYALYALIGIFCLLTFRVFTSTVSDVSNDRKWGVYAIFNMQGGSPYAYLASVIVVELLVFLAQIILLVIAHVVLNSGSLSGNSVTAMGWSIAIAVPIVWGWGGLGAAIGALVNSYSTRDMITTLTSLPIVLSAPLFYALDSAPEYLKVIAQINPLTYQINWMRTPDLQSFMLATVWALACYAIGSVALGRSDRVSTER